MALSHIVTPSDFCKVRAGRFIWCPVEVISQGTMAY